MSKKESNFPSKDAVLSYIKSRPSIPSQKEICDHFGVRGGVHKIRMKALLKVLEKDGFYLKPRKKRECRFRPTEPSVDMPQTIVGRIAFQQEHYVLLPTNRKFKQVFRIQEKDHLKKSNIGHVFKVRVLSLEPPVVSLMEAIGSIDKISMISAQMAELPSVFPGKVLKAAQGLKVPPIGKRKDIRSIPLVTIDGVDSKDFDDAVWAAPDPDYKGGWHIIVAIADVAHYVTPDNDIDKEALNRGTSTYFPDMVIPMLPEALSNDLCSLRPNEDRACVGVHLYIDQSGRKRKHQFFRGLMRSQARLTYEHVQKAYEIGTSDSIDMHHIQNLYGAFKALSMQRTQRGTLEVEMDEPKISVNAEGKIDEISVRTRLDSHRLIEEFMVLANVAAAEFLEENDVPTLYRVHDRPDGEKVQELRQTLKALRIPWSGPLEKPGDFTKLLRSVDDSPYKRIVNEVVLRCQSQAVYTPANKGHFGLNLTHYSHFTSPIRRYPDLLVHRGVLSVLGFDDGLSTQNREDMVLLGNDTSMKERRAEQAERDATDRFMTQYLTERVGEFFKVYVSGVNKAGLFVNVLDMGASGLVPMNRLGDDYYIYKENPGRLEGRRTRRRFFLGDRLKVRLIEADQTKGRLTFELEGVRTKEKKQGKSKPRRKRFKK